MSFAYDYSDPSAPAPTAPAAVTAPAAAADQPGVPAGPVTGGAAADSKSTLWMGELEPWYDENQIRQIWHDMGEQNVTVKLIRDKFTGVNAGYCFVDFGTPASAAKALTFNGMPIPNTQRVFRLNWASGGGLVDRRDDRGPEFSIFVGDLSPEVTEFSLLQLFQSRYASCKSAKIMTDPTTNASRGYGFVRFSDDSHMQRALAEMQGYFLGNRPIRISTATPKTKMGSMGMAGAGVGAPGMYQMSMGPAVGYYGTPQALSQFTDPNNTTVFVGGLSSHVNEDELRRYFAGFGDITYVRIPPGKGCGFVQFVQRHAAETAITQMQGYPIGNSRVRLSWGRSQSGAANGAISGAYRAAAPPPNVYPQMGMAGQPQYGPYGPLSAHAGHIHPNQHSVAGVGAGADGAVAQFQAVPGQPQAQAPVAQIPGQQQPDTLLPLGQDPTEPVPVARLNELYLAARDGRLDRMESDGRGYHGVYAQ